MSLGDDFSSMFRNQPEPSEQYLMLNSSELVTERSQLRTPDLGLCFLPAESQVSSPAEFVLCS